jgi:hypothetical protein
LHQEKLNQESATKSQNEHNNNQFFILIFDSLAVVKDNLEHPSSVGVIRSIINRSKRKMVDPKINITYFRAHSLMQRKLNFILGHLETKQWNTATLIIDKMQSNILHLSGLTGSIRSRVAQHMLVAGDL